MENRLAKLTKLAWLPVLLVTLGLSNWSLAYVAHAYGFPYILGYAVSLAFDGAALIAGEIAMFYARKHGESGVSARLFVILLVAASSFFNAQHAILANDPYPARYFFALFPIIAYVLFELQSRKTRRSALYRAGRIAEPLPAYGNLTWILYPFRTFKRACSVIEYRANKLTNQALVTPEDNLDTVIPFGNNGNSDTARIRAWAKAEGYTNIPSRGRLPQWVRDAYNSAIHGIDISDLQEIESPEEIR